MADNNIGKPLTMVEKVTDPNANTNVIINDNGYVHQAAVNDLLKNSDVNTSLNEVKFDDVAGGKNKFVPNKLNNITIAGEDATITYNDDGSFTINGTINTAWRKVHIGSTYLKQGSYVFSIKNWQLFKSLIFVETDVISWALNDTTSIDITEATKELYFNLSLNAGTYNDVTFYPLLMESGSSPEFEKYIPSIPKLETDIANVKNTLDTKLTWKLKAQDIASGTGVTITGVSEVMVIAKGSGSKFVNIFPASIEGYLVIAYLDNDYIRAYSNGSGIFKGENSSYSYDFYYR